MAHHHISSSHALKIFSRLGLLCIALVQGACAGDLRAPLCTESTFELPDENVGTYRISMPVVQPRDNDLYDLSELKVRVMKTPGGILIDGGTPPGKLLGKLGFKGPTSFRQVQYEDGTFNFGSSLVCVVDDVPYVQFRSANGMYNLSQLNLSTRAIGFSPMAFSVESLRQHAIPFIGFPGDNNNSLSNPQLIVDNRGIAARRLLQAAKPLSVGYAFTRISEEEGKYIPSIHRWRISSR